MQEYSWLDIKFYCILLEQDWQIGGEDRWWGAMILGEDFVNCGCREVFVRLQYGTDDSTSPSTKASTFDLPLSIWCPPILVSRLVLLICWANFFGVVRSSGVRRAISFFSCHICSRRQLRAAAAGLFLFLFCTADRLTLETFSSQGLHIDAEGAATEGVGAGNSFPQSRSKGEVVTRLSLVSSISFSSQAKIYFFVQI